MLLYQIPYMHISNAYHSWGYALKGRQREFNWDVEDGAFLLRACCREAGEDHECQSRRLEMFVRDAACSVADWETGEDVR